MEQQRLSELGSFVVSPLKALRWSTGEGFQTAIGDSSSLKFATAVPFNLGGGLWIDSRGTGAEIP